MIWIDLARKSAHRNLSAWLSITVHLISCLILVSQSMSFLDSPPPTGLPDPAEDWPRLKLLHGVLDRNPLAFVPLKMVTTRLIKCSEIYEVPILAKERISYLHIYSLTLCVEGGE